MQVLDLNCCEMSEKVPFCCCEKSHVWKARIYHLDSFVKFVIWEQAQGRTRRQPNTFYKTEHIVDNVEQTKPVSMIRKEINEVIMISIQEYEIENNNQQTPADELENSNDWLLQKVRLPADGGKHFCENIKKT